MGRSEKFVFAAYWTAFGIFSRAFFGMRVSLVSIGTLVVAALVAAIYERCKRAGSGRG